MVFRVVSCYTVHRKAANRVFRSAIYRERKNAMKKFSFIGAGSLQFTSSCVRDLLTFPDFKECEFALMDTNAKNLAYITKVVEKIVAAMAVPTPAKSRLPWTEAKL